MGKHINRLRILHISDTYPGLHRSVGGAETIARRLVRLFEQTGWVQGLLTTRPDSPGHPGENVTFFYSETLEDLLPEQLQLSAIKGELFPFDPLAVRGVLKTLKRFRPDRVLLHNVRRFSLQTAEICKQAGVPVYMMVYDYAPFCACEFFVDHQGRICTSPSERCLPCHQKQAKSLKPWSGALLPIRARLFAPLLDKIDGFITLSEASRKQLMDAGIEQARIRVIGQPIFFETPVTFGDPRHILFIGWGQARKGLLVAARALAQVQKPFTFEAVGAPVDPAYMEKVRAALKAAGLNPHKCLRGRVDEAQMSAALQRAGIVVIVEQWANMSPVVLHEAMAAGKTVVAGSIGGIPEFIKDAENGFLATFNDPGDFARQINRVLGDVDRQRRIGAKAATAARKNASPMTAMSKFMDLFRQTPDRRINHRLKTWLQDGACVIVCGGNGSRLGAIKNGHPKALIPIGGKPLIRHIMDFWAPYVSRFILVTNRKVRAFEQYMAGLPYEAQLVEEKQQGGGITGALLESRNLLSGRFVMVLGDCLYADSLHIPGGAWRAVWGSSRMPVLI